MPYCIAITEEAERHLQCLSTRDQRTLQAAVMSRLPQDPLTPTRAVKRLRPNPLAQYELRAGDLRVLYNVDVVLVIGRKVGNKLIVAGQEFHGHQDNPPEPPGSRRAQDVE